MKLFYQIAPFTIIFGWIAIIFFLAILPEIKADLKARKLKKRKAH